MTREFTKSEKLEIIQIYNNKGNSIIQSSLMSVLPSLKISVTTEPIGFYSSGNIPACPLVVLGYFLGG